MLTHCATKEPTLTIVMAQQPGQLPHGADYDTMLTVSEFCIWQRTTRAWFRKHQDVLKGVVKHSQKMIRIHPRTYLERTMRGATKI